MSILEVRNISKIYTTRFGSAKVQALSDMNFSVEEGEYAAIMGESGSGKTTLLNILASLDKPTGGEVLLNGKSLTIIREKELSAFRRDNLGFVFQDFNLLDNFSLKDNILLPLVLQKKAVSEMEERLEPIAERLGITELLAKYPYEVSGGQKQRVAIARTLLRRTPVLLLDDSLSAVDTETDARIRSALLKESAETTLILISHRVTTLMKADHILVLEKGRVVEEGTHEELIGHNGLYRRVYDIQMSQDDRLLLEEVTS